MSPHPWSRFLPGLIGVAALALGGCATRPDVPPVAPTGVAYVPAPPGAPIAMYNPLPPDGAPVYDVASVVPQPVPIRQVRPQFPFELRRAGISGTATVDFIVDEFGVPRNVTAVSTSDPGFAQSAASAVSRWRFRPGLVAGRPVRVHLRVPIAFSLNGNLGAYRE